MALATVLAVVAVLVCAGSALALSGSAVKLGEGEFFGPPAVAVDSSGTAYVAWADDLGPADTIHYCAIPAGATGCTHSGVLTPAGGATPAIDRVQVLVDDATVVLLADVYGVGEEYEQEQEWTSTDGGATFNLVNGGKSVVEGNEDADTEPVDALIVPGSKALGYAWVTAGGTPTFAEFPFGSTSECSVKTGHTCPFATLQPEGENLLGNPGASVASTLGPNPGVLGVYETLGKPGCASGTFDTAFAYGSGSQESNNNYNISPGASKSAWKVGLSPGDCEVEYASVGGGPSGLGVVEDNLTNGSTIYHRFDQADNSFDTPEVTIAQEGEESPAVSQDSAGGIYTTYLAGFEGEVRLAYSYNGGTTWSGPATLAAGGGSNLVSSDSGGQGWATWQVGESVYAQSFVATDSIAPAAADTVSTSQSAGAASGADIAVPAGTVGETDHATIAGVNAAGATGTVAYMLYSSSTCAVGTAVFNGGSTGVSGGAVAASAPVTSALAPGQYYWQASYSGNAGSIFGAKGNVANTSACGSEVLTVAAPVSGYTIKSIVTNSDGTVTITLVPIESGEATLVLTVPTASIASVSAEAAKRSKKCKHGQIKIKGKCLPAKTVAGKTSAKGTAGVALKLVVHLSSKIKAELKKGKTVHLTATLTYTSVFGGKATVHTFSLTVKPHKKPKKK